MTDLEETPDDKATLTDDLHSAIEETSDSAQEVEEAIERAEEGGASRAELKALQDEKTAWLKREQELEERLIQAEEKSRRVIKAPRPKAEKVIEGVSDAPKRKSRVSKWFSGAPGFDED